MADAWVDLYWLPLGAGGWFVRRNGRAYEWVVARREHRRPQDLYHAGLLVRHDGIGYAVEMGPVWNMSEPDRGVVCEGPVGSPWLGRFRAFRYEVRCWPGGRIPDADEAVESPRRVTDEPSVVAAVLDSVRGVPTLTWGRDDVHVGEMWNSNSLIAWALAHAEPTLSAIAPPAGGRAPGWRAGLVLASRESSADA